MTTTSAAAPQSSGGYLVGVAFMLGTVLVFATQDAFSKQLALSHPPPFIVMIRYWTFALFVLAISARRPGGIRAAARTKRPALQILRGVLLACQICVITLSFGSLGLADTHAMMASYPLMIAAMSPIFLGERLGLVGWLAVGMGFFGVLIIIQPGAGVFDPMALIPLLGAAMFAVYGVLTRIVARHDRASTSFFYTGVAGAAAASLFGPFFWSTLTGLDWLWMGLLCIAGASGHFLMIKAYEATEASNLQPFAFLQTVIASLYGVTLFGETIDAATILGASLVVMAGLMAIWRGGGRSSPPPLRAGR